jgi:hypothetical protein
MWDEKHQTAATKRFFELMEKFNSSYEAWINGIQSGNPAQYQSQVEDVLRQWRGELERLRAESDHLMANEELIDELNTIVMQVTDERDQLRRLQSEQGTRADQSASVNPKPKQSPYTNILGLQRIFRPSTRLNIIIASVIFAILSVIVLGYFIYVKAVSPDWITTQAYPGGGTAFGS